MDYEKIPVPFVWHLQVLIYLHYSLKNLSFFPSDSIPSGTKFPQYFRGSLHKYCEAFIKSHFSTLLTLFNFSLLDVRVQSCHSSSIFLLRIIVSTKTATAVQFLKLFSIFCNILFPIDWHHCELETDSFVSSSTLYRLLIT